MTRPIAAVDIGTNSMHLMVAATLDDGSFRILTREKEPVRLGSGGGDMKRLSPDAIDRGIECLTRFAAIAGQWDAELHAYATSAVREAKNRDDFIYRAMAEAGVEVEVISGAEEARLIHLGVIQSVPVDRRHLVVDIGGGSTEFVVADSAQPMLTRSLKLGAIRLTDRFFPGGVCDEKSTLACRRYVRSFITPLTAEIGLLDPGLHIASSGTAETLAVMAGRPEVLDSSDLASLTDQLVSSTPKQRLAMSGLDERRKDIIAAGAVLLDEITRSLGIQQWTISELALRAGIVLDISQRRTGGTTLHHLSDLRRESALTVARRYEEDVEHAEHITDLALELFDDLTVWHGLGADERDLLETAGLLHNIGVFVSHSAHHKHSQYLILNTEQLAGFTEHERNLVAQVARYHRKSAPKAKHVEFSELAERDRWIVQVLASILRVAIGLDRSARRVVRSVAAHIEDQTISIDASVDPEQDAELEIYSAASRADLLEKLSKRRVEVVAASRPQNPHPSQGRG
ncbi:MAG: Ppx/GppA family phosphatase [Acidimicrobiales bacterium]|nr:Ppx/GppA family phosphatase [Acidimicrobiales bacterium]